MNSPIASGWIPSSSASRIFPRQISRRHGAIISVRAQTFGLPVSAVTPEIGDTNYPVCGASGGSTTAASVSPAIRIAAGKARDAVLAKVAPELGVAGADDLVAEGGRVYVKGNTAKGMTWKDACRRLGAEPVSVDGEGEDGL